MKKIKKAFINSLLTLTISLLLLELVFFFHAFALRTDKTQSELFAARYADYYFDDIVYDFVGLFADNLTIKRINATYVSVNFTNVPFNYNISAKLGNYSAKLANLSEKVSVNITINYSRIQNENVIYNFSNGAIYNVSYSNPYLVRFSVPSVPSTANFKNYTISYSSSLERSVLTDFSYNLTGEVYVRLNYSDANGSYQNEGYLNNSAVNIFKANYTNGNYFEIRVEANEGKPYLLQISKNDSAGVLYANSIIENNNSSEFYLEYPVFVNITQFSYFKTGYPKLSN